MSDTVSGFAPGLFAGEVVLITGGGTGIGRATALEMGYLGAKIAIASRKRDHLDPTLAELKARGVEAMAETCDIREPEQIAALVEAVMARYGRIDVLVNNAGGQFPTAAESLQPKGWEAVIRNNLNGTFFMTTAVARRAMIPARAGRIVSVTANAKRGFPGMVHTGAARAAVENMTRTLAIEWAQYKIRVNAVAPGTIKSSGTDQYPPELLEASRKRTPMKRFGTPEEVAASIIFLGSRLSSFATGAVFRLDGGGSIWGDNWIIPD
jgi:citronellol/citronellal dehydrogenase